MKVVHEIRLTSDQHFGNRLPSEAVGRVLALVPGAVRYSVAMAFRGRSTNLGRRPKWLHAASDVRFADHSGNGESILYFEAPSLGEAAEDIYKEPTLFPDMFPSPEDSGLDLLGDVLFDVAKQQQDSERYDVPLLKRLVKFRPVFQDTFQELRLIGHRMPAVDPARLDRTVVETAERFSTNTPPPQQLRVVGKLDMIRASTQTFALKLHDGQEVRGLMSGGDVGDLAGLFQQDVLVLGKAVYRTSGRILRIEAQEVTKATDQDNFFSQLPAPVRRQLDVREYVREQQHKRGMTAVFGKWPGDESDEELEQALRELD